MLVAKEHKKLLLNLNDPTRITAIVPGAKLVNIKGHDIVSVNHDQDTVRVLRNMGIEAPGPIRSYYDWSGQYTPFVHQYETSEFATLNTRCYILNDMGCVDSDTEYLSPTGWFKISEYVGGPVAQYHPDKEAIDFVEPLEYVKLPCSTMISIKTKNGLDQKLSPEHRVLLQSRVNPDKREVVSAETLMHRHNLWVSGHNTGTRSLSSVAYTQAAIPTTFLVPGGTGLPLTDDQIRLQIAVIADAHFPNGNNTCVVRLKKDRKKERLVYLLKCAGVEWKERESATVEGFTVYTFTAPTRDKVFGTDWWACTPDQLNIVASEVMHWDGNIGKGNRGDRFSTREKASADFVQYACAACGQTARISVDSRPGRNDCYEVMVRKGGNPLQLASLSSTGERHPVMSVGPSTDGFKYCFQVPSTFLVFRRNGCVFASGNTGKTLSVLWAYDYLRSIGAVDWCLVISPLSTLERVWADAIFEHFPDLSCGIVHGGADRRMKVAQDKYGVHVINHDGIKDRKLMDFFCNKPGVGLIIIDELAVFRNAGTDRWKALNRLVNGSTKDKIPAKEWVWGMTGTPIPNEPVDAWAQCKLVTPWTVPKFFGAFRDLVMKQITPYKWSAKGDALQTVFKAMQPGIRFKREDCIDLPPTTYTDREVVLTAEQTRMYKQMLTVFKAEYLGGQITASNEAVKIGKLLQIVCGVAYGPDGEMVIPAKPRIDEVLELIEQSSAKVIVFVPLTGALNALAEVIGKEYGVSVVHGGVSKGKRDDIFADFMSPHGNKVLVAQPGTMAHGLTLTAADTIIWYAPINSAEIYQQANARIVRPGQTRNTLIARIQGSEMERRMYKRLENRESAQGALLGMFE